MSKSRYQRVIKTLTERQHDVAVLLENVHKPHNLAAIMRSCDATGVPHVHAVDEEGAVRIYSNAAAGTDKWVGLSIHSSVEDAITTLKQQGKTIYAAHFSDQAVDFRSVDWRQPSAILMGTEKWGVSDQAATLVDQHVTIPMHGMTTSLNVSVATALILYEIERQRSQAGDFQHSQISEAELEQRCFEWLQPKMSRYCQDKGLAYPKLDEDGDLTAKPD